MIRPADLKIDIRVDDVEKFRMIAFLVDRNDFLKDIYAIRQNLLHLDHCINYNQVFNYLKELKENSKQVVKNGELLNTRMQKNGINYIFTNSKFVEAVHWMENKYKKNTLFDMVFTYAIVSGVITEKELFSTARLQYLDEKVLENFKLDGSFQVSIVVSRDTRIDEVIKVFNTEVQPFFNMIGFPKPNTFSNIFRDRRWYWLKQSMSWNKLFYFIRKDEKILITNEGIRDAVRQYQQQLKASLYSSVPPGALENS